MLQTLFIVGFGILYVLYKLIMEPRLPPRNRYIDTGIGLITIFLAAVVSTLIGNAINAKQAAKMQEDFYQLKQSCDETYKENEMLRHQLEEASNHIVNTLSNESKLWARDIRKKETFLVKKRKQRLHQQQLTNKQDFKLIPTLLNYAIKEFDTIADAFKTEFPQTQIIKENIPEYFGAEGKQIKLVREVRFLNGYKLILTLRDGYINEKGIIKIYPALGCKEVHPTGMYSSLNFGIQKYSSRLVLSRRTPPIFDIGYFNGRNNDDYPVDYIKKVSVAFKKAFVDISYRHHEG